MSKVWQELLCDDDEVKEEGGVKPQDEPDQMKRECAEKENAKVAQAKRRRTKACSMFEEVGHTSWVSRLYQVLCPIFAELAQKRALKIFSACSGTSPVIQGLEVCSARPPPPSTLTNHSYR